MSDARRRNTDRIGCLGGQHVPTPGAVYLPGAMYRCPYNLKHIYIRSESMYVATNINSGT